jgi:hypothetical protein
VRVRCARGEEDPFRPPRSPPRDNPHSRRGTSAIHPGKHGAETPQICPPVPDRARTCNLRLRRLSEPSYNRKGPRSRGAPFPGPRWGPGTTVSRPSGGASASWPSSSHLSGSQGNKRWEHSDYVPSAVGPSTHPARAATRHVHLGTARGDAMNGTFERPDRREPDAVPPGIEATSETASGSDWDKDRLLGPRNLRPLR